MFYNFGIRNIVVGNSGKWTNAPIHIYIHTDTDTQTHIDKIVGTPTIIKEEVKDKIKVQARKCIVSPSQSTVLITVFAPLINDSFRRTHTPTQQNITDQ